MQHEAVIDRRTDRVRNRFEDNTPQDMIGTANGWRLPISWLFGVGRQVGV